MHNYYNMHDTVIRHGYHCFYAGLLTLKSANLHQWRETCYHYHYQMLDHQNHQNQQNHQIFKNCASLQLIYHYNLIFLFAAWVKKKKKIWQVNLPIAGRSWQNKDKAVWLADTKSCDLSYSRHSWIWSSRGIGLSSNNVAYRIIEHRFWEFTVDGDFKFDRKWDRIK